jgi:predicted nucleic acid-binding protein
VRTYADTSFLVKLIANETGSESAMAEYRRFHLPRLFYLPLHALEVENAVRQKAFYLRRSLPARERSEVSREKSAALSRLKRMLERRLFVEVAADWDDVMNRARDLSAKHTESLGARSLDLLHVSFALELECELFFSADECQTRVAKAEGLKVINVPDAD